MSLLNWLYRRLGGAYPLAFVTVELQTAYPILIGTLAVFSLYYQGTFGEYAAIGGLACGLTLVGTAISLIRSRPALAPVAAWAGGQRDAETAARAWTAAISFPLEMIRRNFWLPLILVVLPTGVATLLILDLDWLALFPLVGGALVALGYSLILHYLAVETGLRPVLIDINRNVTPRTEAAAEAIPLRLRLMAAVPMINVITGLVVAALTSGDEGGGGAADLGIDVLIAVGVATAVAVELSLMLSRSILRPIADLQAATGRISEGRLDEEARVPVTTGDEIGELAASFNQMVSGLRERERLREAFGTYLDREVADYILSEGFTGEGMDAEVSILVCDVRDFTQFASDHSARQVVEELNRLFECVVPVIAQNGGYVDKFLGDGLMAVFGAPEPFPDHADRAVQAACEIARTVNADDSATRFKAGIGVSSGQVLAGSIGGAGRLSFSVIGEAVNVAAHTETATRELGEEVLITGETARRLDPASGVELRARGPVELKGMDEPVELFAPWVTTGGRPRPPRTGGPSRESIAR